VFVTLDENVSYEFPVTVHDLLHYHEEKVNLGKGMKARGYKMTVSNDSGSDFSLRRLQFIGNVLD